MSKPKKRLENILKRLNRERPELDNPLMLLQRKKITVGGVIIENPRSMVERDAPLQIGARELRGTKKLNGALLHFEVDAKDALALDLGACTGGFTTALLEAGARRVYAVDAGAGQLLERLRDDPRVVNLERINLGELTSALIPEAIELMTMDLSYLSIAKAAPQLNVIQFAPGAKMLALVKPMFELGLSRLPDDDAVLEEALHSACDALTANGWEIKGAMRSVLGGHHGAIEFFVFAVLRC